LGCGISAPGHYLGGCPKKKVLTDKETWETLKGWDLYYYNGEGNIYLDDDDVSHNIDT
jgi:hypothetical protein